MAGSESADALGLVGMTISDKYSIEGVVGEGGFAVVYRATHVLWKRPVAVKVFKALGEVAQHERKKLLDDFIQEGALLADLSERSTAICQARDVGMLTTKKGDQVPYMVLEWLEGKPLEAVLEDEKVKALPLRSLEQTVRLLDPIAEALALAHKKGIAHRDVKPANVFVLGDPRGSDVGLKLLDFGIAKVVQDAQKMGFGKTAGHITSFTPSYGAPEQFNRAYGATGPWTDVFALALVTSEVLTGREPVAGDNLVQLAYSVSDPNTRPTPRTLGAQMSDEVDAVFRTAVAVKPTERYQTAGEFWNALRMVVIGHPMSTIISVRSDPAGSAAVPVSDTVVGDLNTGATALAPPGSGPSPSGATSVPQQFVGQHQQQHSPMMTGGGAAPPKKGSSTPIIAAAVAIVTLVGVGGGVLALRGRGATGSTVPSASQTTTVSSAPSASASASGVKDEAKCPPGMKRIAGGEYFMGSDERDAEQNEKPFHKVVLRAYCLDELEVTVAKYKACSDPGTCRPARGANVWPGITKAQEKIYDPLCNVTDLAKRSTHPINCVDWDQARKYCEENGGRLPTEAEWEYAARGSDGRIYPWGADPPSAKLLNACGKECVAWMKKNFDPDQPIAAMYPEDDGWPATAPVGSFPDGKSVWGIQDIVGNVWEWVADWYGDYDPASEKTVTTAPTGPVTGTERVIRGGAWNGAQPGWVRPAWRFRAPPTNRTHGIGFRCAKTL